MKNSTKIRLHLSKALFESLTKQVIKESKSNMGGGAYTEAVKAPKQPKSGKMDEMSSKKKMEKGLYKEVTTGAEMDLHQIADYIGAGDPFWMLVGGVFAIAGGIITAGEIGPKMKGWYNALKQKDSDSDGMQNEGDEQSQAAQIVDLAREVGIRL